MEYLDLYDRNKKKTGSKILRKSKIPEGMYQLVVVIFIQNQKGEFLIQKRARRKDGKWASTGGTVITGETSRQAVIRETKEELGIDITKDPFVLYQELRDEDTYIDLYYLQKEIIVENLILQKEEVERVKWMSTEQIDKIIQNKTFSKRHAFFLKECYTFLQQKKKYNNLANIKIM